MTDDKIAILESLGKLGTATVALVVGGFLVWQINGIVDKYLAQQVAVWEKMETNQRTYNSMVETLVRNQEQHYEFMKTLERN